MGFTDNVPLQTDSISEDLIAMAANFAAIKAALAAEHNFPNTGYDGVHSFPVVTTPDTGYEGRLEIINNAPWWYSNGLWRTISDAMIVFTDVTTGDVSTAEHGFCPKGTNTLAEFLRDDGAWAKAALDNSISYLAADVPMPSASTYYDGASVALAAGTWLVGGQITVRASTSQLASVLWDGTTPYGSNTITNSSLSAYDWTLPIVPVPITLTTLTTLKISAISDHAGETIKAALTGFPKGNTATYITAVRIK